MNTAVNEYNYRFKLTDYALFDRNRARKAGQKISRDNGVLYGNGNILGYDRVGKTYVMTCICRDTARCGLQEY